MCRSSQFQPGSGLGSRPLRKVLAEASTIGVFAVPYHGGKLCLHGFSCHPVYGRIYMQGKKCPARGQHSIPFCSSEPDTVWCRSKWHLCLYLCTYTARGFKPLELVKLSQTVRGRNCLQQPFGSKAERVSQEIPSRYHWSLDLTCRDLSAFKAAQACENEEKLHLQWETTYIFA